MLDKGSQSIILEREEECIRKGGTRVKRDSMVAKVRKKERQMADGHFLEHLSKSNLAGAHTA